MDGGGGPTGPPTRTRGRLRLLGVKPMPYAARPGVLSSPNPTADLAGATERTNRAYEWTAPPAHYISNQRRQDPFTGAVIGGSASPWPVKGAATDGEWDPVASCESGGTGPSTPAMKEKEVKYEHIKTHYRSSGFGPAHAGVRRRRGQRRRAGRKGSQSEENSTRAPTNPNGFGAVAPARHQPGRPRQSHLRVCPRPGQRQATRPQRLGVGNVSSNDGICLPTAPIPSWHPAR